VRTPPQVALTASTESLLFSRAVRTIILQLKNSSNWLGNSNIQPQQLRVPDLFMDLPMFNRGIQAYIENTAVIP